MSLLVLVCPCLSLFVPTCPSWPVSMMRVSPALPKGFVQKSDPEGSSWLVLPFSPHWSRVLNSAFREFFQDSAIQWLLEAPNCTQVRNSRLSWCSDLPNLAAIVSLDLENQRNLSDIRFRHPGYSKPFPGPTLATPNPFPAVPGCSRLLLKVSSMAFGALLEISRADIFPGYPKRTPQLFQSG